MLVLVLVSLTLNLTFGARCDNSCPTTFTCEDDENFLDGWGADCALYAQVNASPLNCLQGGACVDCNSCPCKLACGFCTQDNVMLQSCFDCVENGNEECIDGGGSCGDTCPGPCDSNLRTITEFKGDEINEFEPRNIDSCCEECIDRSNCVGWSLDGDKCTLFSDIDEARRKTGHVSGCPPSVSNCPSP